MLKNSPKTKALMVAMISLALSNVGFLPSTVEAAGKAGSNKADDAPSAGQLIVTGNVSINDKKAVNGTTVFSNSRIAVACAKGNGAIVNLGRLGRVELGPGTKIMLKFKDGVISGDLLEGKALVNTPPGVKVSINTPDGVTNSDGKEASVTPVNSQRGVRCVPAAVNSSSGGSNSTLSALSPGALAALIVGIGGAAAAGAVVASDTNTNAASSSIP